MTFLAGQDTIAGLKCVRCGEHYPSKYYFKDEGRSGLVCTKCAAGRAAPVRAPDAAPPVVDAPAGLSDIPAAPPFVSLPRPKSPKDWKALRDRLATTEATQYPGVNPDMFAEFRRLVLRAMGVGPFLLWGLIGIGPGLVLVVTEKLLHTMRWGGLVWGASAVWIVFCQYMGGAAQRKAGEEALDLGTRIGMLQSKAPPTERSKPG